ncbi:MAG: CDP-diacylglycerol--serine O-phosphatidyltransferase [Desulfohalobiaceae bacterium]|nr:CDP-diacylglycerol--serine O-phosphatidyltransferase [Desulfohalobiaceae bacterium]
MQESRNKSVYILPNLLTTASLFTGFLAVLWAVEGYFIWSATGILVSCVFDGLDGKVARMTKGSSRFGIQLDSLADLVSFGVAPALMIFLWQTSVFGRLGIASSFLFLACGALRLARFNIQSDQAEEKTSKFFVGLPIPAAACSLSTLVLFSTYLPATMQTFLLPAASLLLMIILALLMVSQVRYASFKEVEYIRAHPFTTSVSVVLLFVLVASEPKLLGFLFSTAYLASGPIYSFLILPLRRGTFLGGLIRHKP